jgi:hypothetical protein
MKTVLRSSPKMRFSLRVFRLPLFSIIVLRLAPGIFYTVTPMSAAERPGSTPLADAQLPREQLDFFEAKIRPLLADRCYECHSATAKKLKANLRVDTRDGLLQGGDLGPAIVPGHPEKSLLIEAVQQLDKDLAMPPKSRLEDHEIQALQEWIKMGAPDPRTVDASARGGSAHREIAQRHWAYQPIQSPTPPEVADSAWAHHSIDRFIFAALEKRGLHPVEEADKRTLLRRAAFDLHGLPPTAEEVTAFMADASPDAWEQAIDRLLASPRYGERWGRHWMDVVRYADTAGDNSDYPIPQAWRYRNYVIDAFNADKPFDQFIREQIAGDLLPARDHAQRQTQIIATGYIALSRRFGSVVDRYPHHLTIEDTLDNMGRTFLGLGLSCARCHDHKFDPISQRDYYGLYGFFSSTRYAFPGIELLKVQKDFVPLVPPEELATVLAPFQDESNRLQAAHEALLAQRQPLENEKKEVETRIDKASDAERPALQQERDALHQKLEQLRARIRDAAKAIEDQQRKRPSVPDAYAVQDGAPADARVQLRGDPEKLGDVVPRKFLDVLGGATLPADAAHTTSGRLQLAEWIASATNPLTARVIVNRIWQHHFGAGIVTTPNDFGVRATPPSHPELLDWLANQFIADGWSMKRLHKRIMLSRTFRLGSGDNSRALAADPANRSHWRYSRRRLDAESLRDTTLLIAGLLDETPLAAPHPFPPPAKWDFTQHHPFRASYPSKHRSVYLMTSRLTAVPFFQTFDGPDRNASTPVRDESVTTLQALFMMNDGFVDENATHLAKRLLRETSDPSDRITRAYLLAFQREPTAEERSRCETHLAAAQAKLSSANAPDAGVEERLWASLARALFRTNEFLYID